MVDTLDSILRWADPEKPHPPGSLPELREHLDSTHRFCPRTHSGQSGMSGPVRALPAGFADSEFRYGRPGGGRE